MKWSPQQDAALSSASNWLKNGAPGSVYRLFGYAGTGKTTLAQYLAEGVDGTVRYGAYTGKAASVMRKAGCTNAQTIHSMIYHPKQKSQLRLRELEEELANATSKRESDDLKKAIEAEKQNLKRPSFILNMESDLAEAALLIIDECSMVDAQMAQDLLSFGVPVLALGDPAQLPPVGGEGWFTGTKPNTMLTEIHRQARENPIIRMATEVREGRPLQAGKYGESEVIKGRPSPDIAMEAGQILMGLNKTRLATNSRVRQLKGHTSPWPVAGEKLVCLRNSSVHNLLNGTIHIMEEDAFDAEEYIGLTVRSEDGGETTRVMAHRQHFTGNPETIDINDRMTAQEFTFGYGLTVHKAQGSQWENVMLIDDWFGKNRQQWLYTGITRAAEKVTVVRS